MIGWRFDVECKQIYHTWILWVVKVDGAQPLAMLVAKSKGSWWSQDKLEWLAINPFLPCYNYFLIKTHWLVVVFMYFQENVVWKIQPGCTRMFLLTAVEENPFKISYKRDPTRKGYYRLPSLRRVKLHTFRARGEQFFWDLHPLLRHVQKCERMAIVGISLCFSIGCNTMLSTVI